MITARIIEIIEDRAALEQGLRILQEAAERKALPESVFLPTFNDSMLEENFRLTVEMVAGQLY